MRVLRIDDSSNIAGVGYDSSTRTLRVRFINGGVYDYKNVGPQAFIDLTQAESVGKYFSKHIRTGYAYDQVESRADAEPTSEERMRSALQLIASTDLSASCKVDRLTQLNGCVAAAREALEP
jgi:hypothetical protein